ncbi:MAG: UDP-3-O-(3-hydroxymyristoyl)glucosamine N-acyltransferase [Mariprofundaceae bacterium]
MRLSQLAELLSGRLEHADADAEVVGLQTLEAAGPRDATFLSNMRYKHDLDASRAGVVLIGEDVCPDVRRPLLRLRDPYLAAAMLQRHLHPVRQADGSRHASAAIAPSARLADDVEVGAAAVIGEDVEIAAGTRIGAACVIGDGASIGQRCLLHARAVVAHACVLGDRVILQSGVVIGSDGFGYAWDGQEHLKTPQVGAVVIEDDVEIGANTCIDRGAIGDTIIGRGAKLDNLIQIAHNVRVGPFTVMASQVGISGSTHIGAGCQLGGQVGMAGHIKVGDGCKVAGKSGVISDLEAGGAYAGFPTMPHGQWLRMSAIMARLPSMWKMLSSRTQATNRGD